MDKEDSPQPKRVSTMTKSGPSAGEVGGWNFSSTLESRRSRPPESLPHSYPNELRTQTETIIAEAIEKYPYHQQITQMCRNTISRLTLLFSAAIKKKKMRATSAKSKMAEVLHSVLICNCDSDKERYQRKEELRKSEEWRHFLKEVARAEKLR